MILTSEEYQSRWESLLDEEAPPAPRLDSGGSHRYFLPLDDAADEFVRWAQSPHERVYTGFADLDAEMRGIAPGEMAMLIGYSHAGKTLVLLEMLRANRDKYVIYFVPDEPRTLVLIKLAAVLHGIDALELEQRVAADDGDAITLLHDTALVGFPNLAVFDESVTLSDMERAYNEVAEMWGRPADLVVLDYLDLLQGGGEDVPGKASTLKGWGRRHDVPLLVLHQTSRTSGADGKRLTISSGAYGGEQQATHIMGVRRKRFDIAAQLRDLEEKLDRGNGGEKAIERLDSLRYDLAIHDQTLTINLVKNKRPAGRLIDDMDFEIEQGTGRLTRLRRGDLPMAYRHRGHP